MRACCSPGKCHGLRNGNDDSFYVGVDAGDRFPFHTGRHEVFEWAPVSRPGVDAAEVFEVSGGLHELIIHGREDGTKLRSIRFSGGGCGFLPQTNRLPESEPASAGVMTGTFRTAMDYVWSPPVAAGVDAAQDSNGGATDCMTAHPATDNMQW